MTAPVNSISSKLNLTLLNQILQEVAKKDNNVEESNIFQKQNFYIQNNCYTFSDNQDNLTQIILSMFNMLLQAFTDKKTQQITNKKEAETVSSPSIQKIQESTEAAPSVEGASKKETLAPTTDIKGRSIENQYLLAYINETMGTTDVTAEDVEKKMYSKTVNADGSTSTKYNQKYSLSAQILKNGGDKEKQADLLRSVLSEKIMNEARLDTPGKSVLNSILNISSSYSKVGGELVNGIDLSADEKIAVYTNALDNFEQLVAIAKEQTPADSRSLDSVMNNHNESIDRVISVAEIVCKGNSELLELEKSRCETIRVDQGACLKQSWRPSNSGPVFGA